MIKTSKYKFLGTILVFLTSSLEFRISKFKDYIYKKNLVLNLITWDDELSRKTVLFKKKTNELDENEDKKYELLFLHSNMQSIFLRKALKNTPNQKNIVKNIKTYWFF